MSINKKISDNTKFIIALLMCSGIGKAKVYNIYKTFLSNEELIIDDKKNIEHIVSKIKIIEKSNKVKIDEKILRNNLNEAEDLIDDATKKSVKITSIDDSDYPKRFKNIGNYKPPVIFYSKGDLSSFESSYNVAIIGTWKPTDYGLKITEHFSKEFAKNGCSIISGLALGCDTQAHKSCLEVNGKTMAILPGDVDNVLPSPNRNLANDILDNGGVLLSEHFKINKVNKGMFVQRDKLQSFFSDIILISSANLESGTKYAIKTAEKLKKMIITCKPSFKHENEEMFKGNLNLIKNKTAIQISENDDIHSFLKESRGLIA
ncbi:MAG: DNA-protecting protein DprA [Methanobrevibacter sp.]|jgi:DNA processing protein|nr:DNA-protecting protein DprA [Candidatus Methanovirga meridionalis]